MSSIFFKEATFTAKNRKNHKNITKDNLKAKEMGLTYGQYKALETIECTKIIRKW